MLVRLQPSLFYFAIRSWAQSTRGAAFVPPCRGDMRIQAVKAWAPQLIWKKRNGSLMELMPSSCSNIPGWPVPLHKVFTSSTWQWGISLESSPASWHKRHESYGDRSETSKLEALWIGSGRWEQFWLLPQNTSWIKGVFVPKGLETWTSARFLGSGADIPYLGLKMLWEAAGFANYVCYMRLGQPN